MCAIVDANRADDVFGRNQSEAGRALFEWIVKGSGRIVIGGEVKRELTRTSAKAWLRELSLAGRAISVADARVDDRAKEIGPLCRSNDAHVVALAQVSGARLLYSNDRRLHEDFGNSTLVNEPRGSIYSTYESDRFNRHHRGLLRRDDLCRTPK